MPCEACLEYSNNAAHHIITKARNGGDDAWNLMTLCFKCHRYWHDNPFDEVIFKLGLMENLISRGFMYDSNTKKLYREKRYEHCD
jgi:hypothetical protein